MGYFLRTASGRLERAVPPRGLQKLRDKRRILAFHPADQAGASFCIEISYPQFCQAWPGQISSVGDYAQAQPLGHSFADCFAAAYFHTGLDADVGR